jgi:membrane protease YdiL (CAAX protease family)
MSQSIAPNLAGWHTHAYYVAGFTACCITIPTFATGALAASRLLAVALPVNKILVSSMGNTSIEETVTSNTTEQTIFSSAVIAPIREEIVYRGIMQTALSHITPYANAITSVWFGASHINGTTKRELVVLFYATALSYLLLGPLMATHGLAASIAAHTMHNISTNIMDEGCARYLGSYS